MAQPSLIQLGDSFAANQLHQAMRYPGTNPEYQRKAERNQYTAIAEPGQAWIDVYHREIRSSATNAFPDPVLH